MNDTLRPARVHNFELTTELQNVHVDIAHLRFLSPSILGADFSHKDARLRKVCGIVFVLRYGTNSRDAVLDSRNVACTPQ